MTLRLPLHAFTHSIFQVDLLAALLPWWLDQGGVMSVRESALARWVHEYAPMGSRPSLRVVDGGVKLKA